VPVDQAADDGDGDDAERRVAVIDEQDGIAAMAGAPVAAHAPSVVPRSTRDHHRQLP
jgi:hypothetical protein